MEMILMAAVTIALLGVLALTGIGIENYLLRRRSHLHHR